MALCTNQRSFLVDLKEQNKKWQRYFRKPNLCLPHRPKLPSFFFLFQKQNSALSLKHYFHVLDVNVEVSVVVFSAILIAFWMPTIIKNIFDVRVYQQLHYG